MVPLITEILLYSNPFSLKFVISGNEAEKNLSLFALFVNNEYGIHHVYLTKGVLPSKRQTAISLGVILRSAIHNCEKVAKVADNLAPEPEARRLTLEMVDKIVEALSITDVWDVDTSTNDWKKKFLTKADGLVEGQEVSLVYTEGPEKGKTIKGILLSAIEVGRSFGLDKMQYWTEAVTGRIPDSDGSYTISTKDWVAVVTITNTRQ